MSSVEQTDLDMDIIGLWIFPFPLKRDVVCGFMSFHTFNKYMGVAAQGVHGEIFSDFQEF